MRILFSTFVALFVSSLSYGQGGSARVAFIDMEYILKYTPEYTEASAQLSTRADEWKKEVETKKSQIKKLKSDLAAERILLTRDLIEDKEEEIANLENDLYQYQQTKFGTEGDYMSQKVMLAKPIQDEVFSVIQDIAEARKFDYVLDKNSESTMLIGASRYDISDLVIRRMASAKRKQNMTPKQVAAVEQKEKEDDAIALRQSRREEQKKRKEEAERQLKAEAKDQKLQPTMANDNSSNNSMIEAAKRAQEEKLREAEEKRKQIEQERKQKIEAQKQALLQQQKDNEEKKRLNEENKRKLQQDKQNELLEQQQKAQKEQEERERKINEEKERKRQEALNQQNNGKNEALEKLLDQKRKEDEQRRSEAERKQQEAAQRKQQQIEAAIKEQEERKKKNEREQEERRQRLEEQRKELERQAQEKNK
ncbi:MAG: OmpH family outer membrane protein [Flavobacteriaceae bacterium]|jgi:Skp family chaperone for outer membrane proteins|nr:OmpH family outer membrane protein [Flavobacteriaceae bacterium]